MKVFKNTGQTQSRLLGNRRLMFMFHHPYIGSVV